MLCCLIRDFNIMHKRGLKTRVKIKKKKKQDKGKNKNRSNYFSQT